MGGEGKGVVANFSKHQDHLEGLLKYRLWTPSPKFVISVGLELDLRI